MLWVHYEGSKNRFTLRNFEIFEWFVLALMYVRMYILHCSTCMFWTTYIIHFFVIIPYSTKFWWDKLANLAKPMSFANILPSQIPNSSNWLYVKCLSFCTQWLIHQSFILPKFCTIRYVQLLKLFNQQAMT